jgi:hypothetical protein
MAQWYATLLFRGDRLLGEGVVDLEAVAGVQPDAKGEPYTAVLISGYSLYGKLRGYYALGISSILMDPDAGAASYASQDSALRKEPLTVLSPDQRSAVREWLIQFDPEAWENSGEAFKLSLGTPVPEQASVG